MDFKALVQKVKNTLSLHQVQKWIIDHVAPLSAETLNWIGVIFIHAATIPSLLAVMTGLSDRMPPLDMVLLIWGGLIALFIQSIVLNNRVQIVTISVGFMVQSLLLALIFFN